ncbi:MULTISPECIES: DUF6465 family protein [unclassified Butyrivibrio]|uniref:DUF6465 family protein n=1 Tax=unclassified Butyrivibrio TaxID=2639466 RepID=UPI0004168AF7|nr:MULTISPECIES: DUF6465 family protein [unclassified Butyrivibrio]
MAGKKTTDKLMDIAKNVSEAAKPYVEKAEPYIEMAKEKAEPVIDEVKEKGGPVLKDVIEKAEPVIKEVKKRAEPATKVIKEQGEKAADVVKAATRDITESNAKKNAKVEFFIQYKDYEVRTEDIAQIIREKYVSEGHKISDIKELQIYLKPEENTAYYVVNHTDTGKFTY